MTHNQTIQKLDFQVNKTEFLKLIPKKRIFVRIGNTKLFALVSRGNILSSITAYSMTEGKALISGFTYNGNHSQLWIDSIN